MRNPAWLALLPLLPGCYLFHGVPGGGGDDAAVSRPTADAALPLDAGPPVMRPSDPRADAGPPPVLVPDGGVLAVERPDEGITCDNAEDVLADACGALRVVYVASDGRAGGAGTALDPFGALDTALAACGARCEVRIEQGELQVARTILREGSCVWISGGWARERDAWTPTDARTILSAAVSGPPSSGALLQTRSRPAGRARVDPWHLVGRLCEGAVGASRRARRRGGRERPGHDGHRQLGCPARLRARRVRRPHLRTRIRNARYGMKLADRTLDAIVDDVDIEDGVAHEGLRVHGARRVLIRRARVRTGAGTALGVTDGAQHVTIEDSHFDGRHDGAYLDAMTSHVLLARSTVLGCDEPLRAAVGASGVQIVETTSGACTFDAE